LGYSPRILIASIIAFSFDLVILILVYQTLSNLRNKFPSRFAGGLALLVALWSDAFIFSIIGLGGDTALGQDIFTHLVGKSIAGLALFPLLIFYLHNIAPIIPDSAASYPRPALDFFTTSMQLEARASHHYRLLQTLSEINKLVYSSSNAHNLLQQACHLIAQNRDYLLVCIARNDGRAITELIQVGKQSIISDELLSIDDSPWRKAYASQLHVISVNTGMSATAKNSWFSHMAQLEIKTVAAFPMRYDGQVYGTLNLFSKDPISLDSTEIEIIENLADDLAYGLVSIQARKQQAILMTAAETMQDGLLISDLEGNLIYVNSIVARISGIPAHELVGQNIADLLTKEQASGFPEILDILLRRGRLALEIEYRSRLASKLIISSLSSVVKNEDGQPQLIVINIREITHQRRYENQLLTLNRLTTDLVQIRDIQELMDKTLQISEEMLNADASILYLLSPNQNKITNILSHDLPDEIVQSMVHWAGELTENNQEPIFIEDLDCDPGYRKHIDLQAENSLRSMLVIPICFQVAQIGMLMAFFKRLPSSPEDQIQLGMILAQTLAIIIQNARLYENIQSRIDEMTALVTASTSLSTYLDHKKTLQVITEQLTKTLDIQACAISDFDQDNGTLRLLVELIPDDWDSDPIWYQSMTLENYPQTREVLETGEVCQLRIDDPDIDQSEYDFMIQSDINYLLILPLVTQEGTIGLIELMDNRIDKTVPESQMVLIRILANQAAIAIQNARLYQAEQHQRQLAEALIQAAGSLNSTLDLEEVFDIILDQVMLVVPCQAANIMMVTNGYGYVHRFRGYKRYKDYTKTIKSIRIPISNPNIQTMLNGDFVLVSDTHNTSTWEIYSGSEWIKSYVGIPLKIEQDVVGFLNVNSDIPGFFTEETAHQLQTFADHAAIAYRNADLYQQLQDYASELEIRVQNRTAELKAAKEHLEGILTSVPDAVFVLNQNDDLIQSNDAGDFLLNSAKSTNKELLSKEFLSSIKETSTPDLQNLLEVDGRSYQALASDIQFDEEQPSGHVIIFRDVTHFKELDQLKSQFVSDVSHELRTPLTNMTLYLEFLETDQISSIQQTYLDILKRETKRLTNLIEDLLTFSRLQVGKISGDIQQLDVNQIVEQMTVDRAYLAAKHEIQLEYVPLVQLPPAMGDENWLSQSLANLLTNAINYTPAKGKVILQTNVKGKQQHNWVVIEVIDNGVGIAETEIPHIFDRFYRGAASQVTGAEGTGLGLAISKELLTRMGGDITVESKLGKGSTFTIWLRPAVTTVL
jgi:PAS domain S-box-containing protein